MTGLKSLFPPDQAAVLQEVVRHIMVNLNCVQVGKVSAFDSAEQTVDVALLIKQVKSELPDGTKVYQDASLIMKLPILILSGGGAHLTMPITAGDTCIVLFNDRDLDNWFQNGTSQPPNTYRCHDLSDGFALVGVRSLQSLIQSYLTGGIELLLNANTYLRITDGQLTIKGNVSIEGDVDVTGSQTITGDLGVTGTLTGGGTNMNTHVHGGVQTGIGNTGAPHN